MATTCIVRVNITNNDNEYPGNESDYVLMALATDKLIFSQGSSEVADGKDTPTDLELINASMQFSSNEQEIPHTFLLDASEVGAELKEIFMANSGSHRYVFNLYFDGETVTEPTLEAWDDNSHASADNHCLGNGNPNNSMLKAIATTLSAPDADWEGTPIAGLNVLGLNNSAAMPGGGGNLYFNMHWDISPAYSNPFVETPVITIRFAVI